MKKLFSILFVLLLAKIGIAQEKFPFQDTTLSIEQRVDDLLRRLTIDEKLALMEHRNPAIPRLGLYPYSWWNEALHGVARNGIATVYPMPIALAATFDPKLIEHTFSNIGHEAHYKFATTNRTHTSSAQTFHAWGSQTEQTANLDEPQDNTGLTFFSPNINIFRDPRWGRGMETFGEDPYLTARMGLAVVRGLQGPDPNHLLAAACLKHLAVHSGPEGLRHEFDSKVSMRDLWTTYLPAFEYIIKRSDVQQVMCGYNRLNGEPCCTNKDLLVDILRNKWHFNNLMVTDCWALNDCWDRDTIIPRHKTHPTAAVTAGDAFGSEIDLECGSGLGALRLAFDSGYVSMDQINQHVARILRTRLLVGIDDPQVRMDDGGWKGDEGLALQTARQSIVLLKNDGLLPLQMTSLRKIAVVGPNAADSAVAVGNYNGTPKHVVTVKEAFESVPNVEVFSHPACTLVGQGIEPSKKYWRELKKNDVIVFVGGLSPELEGEQLNVRLPGFDQGDRTQIELPSVQERMIKEIKRRTHKPIVLVLFTGSAIGLESVVNHVDAIIVGWYGGQEIGEAVRLAMTDKNSPFGRLPVTFYRSTSQLPDFSDYSMQGRTYRYLTNAPLYPFGYGLDYGSTTLQDVSFDRTHLSVEGKVKVSFPTNAVVQVYMRNLDDPKGPEKSLVAFENIKCNGLQNFSIPIDQDMLRYFDDDAQELVAPKPGMHFQLMIGTSSDSNDLQTIDFKW